MAYALLILAMTVYKAKEFWDMDGFHGSRLVFVLIRDQAMYFILCVRCPSHALIEYANIFFRMIFVAIFAILGDQINLTNMAAEHTLASLGNPTILSILGSRIFFNLREAAEHGVNVGTNWSSYSHSAIHFEGPQGGG